MKSSNPSPLMSRLVKKPFSSFEASEQSFFASLMAELTSGGSLAEPCATHKEEKSSGANQKRSRVFIPSILAPGHFLLGSAGFWRPCPPRKGPSGRIADLHAFALARYGR